MLEFGAAWCGHCRAVRPWIDEVLSAYPAVRHFRIEDGKGKRLGRSFAVKLWPTLIFMRGGHETGRVVRPTSRADIEQAMQALLSENQPRPTP